MGELADAVESYRRWLAEDERRGPVTLGVSCELRGGTEVAVQIGRHSVRVDEPKRLGGGSTAPNPVGYLMAAVGSCEAIGLSYWSDILEVPFDTVEILVEGDIHPGGAYGFDDANAPSFRDMRIEVRISGSEPKGRYEELVAKTNAHSPLLATLSNPIPVSTTVRVQ